MAPKKGKVKEQVGRARSDLDRFRDIERARVRRRLRRKQGGREPSYDEFMKVWRKHGVMKKYTGWKEDRSSMNLEVEDARPVDYN